MGKSSEGTNEARDQRYKERLVRSGRMYAMCQKAGIEDPLLPVSLALAAFDEVPLDEATAFVRTNKSNLEDLAWTFLQTGSPEEFEEKFRQRQAERRRQSGQRSTRSGG